MTGSEVFGLLLLVALICLCNDLILLKLYFKDLESTRTDLHDCYEVMNEVLTTSKEVNEFCLNQYTLIDDKIEGMDKSLKDLVAKKNEKTIQEG